MKYLFKEKRYRPLGVLMTCILLYSVIAVVSVVLIFTTGHNPLERLIKWSGALVSLIATGFCITMWRSDHKHWVQREQEQEKRSITFEYSEQELLVLKEVGFNTKFLKPMDYKKYRRRSGWMWSAAILANLFSLSTYFW